MKVSGGLFLILLIVVAIVLMLRVQEVQHVQDSLDRMMPHLEEEGVEATIMRRQTAIRRLEELEALCESPSEIEDRVPWLKDVAAEAASWAAGAPSPSAELTVAVCIRTAAAALREYAVYGRQRSIDQARSKLREARSSLQENQAPGHSTDGLRDRLKNLEQSQREHYQDLDEAL